MKSLLLPLAMCAALGGCYAYAPYGYWYPYDVPDASYPPTATTSTTGAPNTTAQAPNVTERPTPRAGTVDPNAQAPAPYPYPYNPYPYNSPYAYPYAWAYPYPYGYPYAYPSYYGGAYGYSPIWVSGSFFFGGHGHGGHGHGGGRHH